MIATTTALESEMEVFVRPLLWLLVWTFVLCGCGSSCPNGDAPSPLHARWEQELDARKLLVLDARSKIDIKRDVHNLVVSADADALAKAFHSVMKDPNRRFGLIKVDRKASRRGQDFVLNERFQGRYELDQALSQKLHGRWKELFGELAEEPPWCRILWDIENQHTSDYGIISELSLNPPPGAEFRLAYRYLEGSPIAGSSTFIVTPLMSGRSRLTQIFEYQELTADFARFFSSGGLRLHNQVVYSQVEQAAALAGGAIVESDIPPEYAKF
jgi:hypothetical protein